MNTGEKTLLAMLTLVTVVAPVALGVAFGWPVWSWLLLAVPPFSVLVLVARSLRVRQELHWLSSAVPPGHVEQPDHTPVTDVALHSAVASYDFYFSATVHWRPARGSRVQHPDPGALAAKAIINRAEAIAAAEQPDKVDIVQRRLASALGAVQPDASGDMEVWADQVQLTLSETDQEWLRKLSDKRKDKDLWELERDLECRKRAYLSDDVLKSTSSAVTWWLAHKDHDVEDTVRLLGPLAQLSAVVNDREGVLSRHLVPTATAPGQHPFESPQQFPNGSFPNGSHQITAGTFPDISPAVFQYGAWLDTLDLDEQRALFSRYIAQVLSRFEKPDTAQEIRRLYNAPAIGKDLTSSPEPD